MKLLFLSFSMVLVGRALWADVANLSVLVLDEDQDFPITRVGVAAYFSVDIGWRAWTDSSVPNKACGLTDLHGTFRFSGKTNCGKVGCWIDRPPPGYYRPSKGWGHNYSEKSVLGVWQPDNLVATIKLQRVEHPIPLFVKQFTDVASDSVRLDLFAKGNGRLQLDLLKGEWLPPVGNGEYADVVFTRLPREDLGVGTNARGVKAPSYRDSMSVKFIGDGNGIVEVSCSKNAGIKIRNAPLDGYRQDYLCWKERMKNLKHSSHYDDCRNFAFRIRTEFDVKGKVKSAHYGKIYGDIGFKKMVGVGVVAVAAPSFLYYLNPTPNDRNLEWDMKNNLCPNPGDIGSPKP